MDIRNVVVKYSLMFVILFSIVYFGLGMLFYTDQREQTINEASKQLQRTINQVSSSVIDQNDADFEHFLTDDMSYLLTEADHPSQDELWGLMSSKIEQSNHVYIEQMEYEDQDLLVAGIQSDQFLLIISRPMSTITEQLIILKQLLISVAFFVIGSFLIFAYYLSRRISVPLNQIKASTRRMIDGDFDIKLPMDTHDDMGELAMVFNRLSRQLGNQLSTLLQEKEILFSIIGSMKDGVMTINLAGEIIISNQEAEAFIADLHFEQNSIDKKQLPDEFNHFFQMVIDEGTSQNFYSTIQGREWDIIITPLHRKTMIQGAVALIRDVTEHRQLDQLRETFIANASHELRTPISLLQGYSEAIIDGVVETVEEQRELAQIIHEESERMGRLVNELLDLTHLKSGHLELNLANHALDTFINKIVAKFNNRLRDHRLTFNTQFVDDLGHLAFDYDRFEQVFTNLIDNAIKHTPENGTISLTIGKQTEQVDFILSDTGVGIPEGDLPFIFERFYMADKSRTRTNKAKKGTGLGLAIVKQIIEAHQGTISIQSKHGEGTIVTISIPIKTEAGTETNSDC